MSDQLALTGRLIDDLGNFVLELVPQGFARVLLEAELDVGWADLKCRYWTAEGLEQRLSVFGRAGHEIHKRLDRIRNTMGVSDGQMWSHCTLTIAEDQQFSFNVAHSAG